MAKLDEMLQTYRRRQRDTLIDTVTTGLSYADEVSVDLGLLDDTGVLRESLETISGALPFALIAVTEQAKVICGKKTEKAALGSTGYRMLKTGAAMTVGAAAVAVGGGMIAAVPAAIGTRVLLDKYKSKTMLGYRLQKRTDRLRGLADKWQTKNANAVVYDDANTRKLTEAEE